MKNLSPKEAMEILNDMKAKIEIPKAAVMQYERNAALDMAIEALRYSEIPNSLDCISRNAAIDAIRASTSKYTGFMEMEMYTDDDAVEAIKALPSVQPEIIRCRDCKHYYYADNRVPQEQRYVCDIDFYRWNPDDYCSYAERRTDA